MSIPINLNNRTFRIIAGLIVIASVAFGYWWLTWTLAVIFLFIFPTYYEIIITGIAYDALYGITHIFTVASLAVFIIVFFLRKYLIAYA